jgi:hypothetical protein
MSISGLRIGTVQRKQMEEDLLPALTKTSKIITVRGDTSYQHQEWAFGDDARELFGRASMTLVHDHYLWKDEVSTVLGLLLLRCDLGRFQQLSSTTQGYGTALEDNVQSVAQIYNVMLNVTKRRTVIETDSGDFCLVLDCE